MKLLVFTCAVTALLLCTGPVHAEEKADSMVEQTTESPIADMALVDNMHADDSGMKTEKEVKQKLPAEVQPQTIADFIIHPLIALKPRLPETESGKQAETGSTTPSPWQLFGFNAGQGLGSSVQSLAGSVTGWLGNRIQLPGLIDTPVGASSTSTSTTTTTVRPDVVVRVKQRASTRKPLIAINNDNRPNRKNKRPNNFNGNNVDDSEEDEEDDSEEDDEDNYNGNRKRYQNHDEDDEDDDEEASNENNHEDDEEEDEEDGSNNHDDESEDEQEEERPVRQQNINRRRRPKPLNHNNNNQRRRINNNNQRKRNQQRQRQQQQLQQEESAEEDQYVDDDDNNDQDFYYQGSKRSQNEQNFIQRGQQSLLKQIRQLTRGQAPAEVSNSLRKSANKRRRQQATLIINRNGQTIYVAPELLQVAEANNNRVSATKTKRPISQYPQPPLTEPYRRKGQPTQYITIPWNQLGIAPPDQLVSLTDGIQSQPLILNIPQNAIDNMQSLSLNKKKPTITADAVPLLAEASIMDIFKPPRIPPARTPTTKKSSTSHTPVVIATKTKPGHTRIRPATIVEKAPVTDSSDEEKTEANDNGSESAQFIVIGDESGETELSRGAYQQILEYFNQQRTGRQLNVETATAMATPNTEEQLIPVQVISADEETAKIPAAVEDTLEMVSESSVMASPMAETLAKKAETMMAAYAMEGPKEEAKIDVTETMMESAVMEGPKEEAKEDTKVEKAEIMMDSPVMVSPKEETKVDVAETVTESSTLA